MASISIESEAASAWKRLPFIRRINLTPSGVCTSFNDASSRSSFRLPFHFIAQSRHVFVSFASLSERLYDYCFFVGVHGCRTALTAAAEEREATFETVSTGLFDSRSVETREKTGIACIIEQTVTPCEATEF